MTYPVQRLSDSALCPACTRHGGTSAVMKLVKLFAESVGLFSPWVQGTRVFTGWSHVRERRPSI